MAHFDTKPNVYFFWIITSLMKTLYWCLVDKSSKRNIKNLKLFSQFVMVTSTDMRGAKNTPHQITKECREIKFQFGEGKKQKTIPSVRLEFEQSSPLIVPR